LGTLVYKLSVDIGPPKGIDKNDLFGYITLPFAVPNTPVIGKRGCSQKLSGKAVILAHTDQAVLAYPDFHFWIGQVVGKPLKLKNPAFKLTKHGIGAVGYPVILGKG